MKRRGGTRGQGEEYPFVPFLPVPLSPCLPLSLSADRNSRNCLIFGLIDGDPEFLGLHRLAGGLGAVRKLAYFGVTDDIFPLRSVLGVEESDLNRPHFSVIVMHHHCVVASEVEFIRRVARVRGLSNRGFDGVTFRTWFNAIVCVREF